MKTTISYVNMSDDAKREKALADIRVYLGDTKYDLLVAAAQAPQEYSIKQMLFLLEILAGIEGYPVDAFLMTYRPTEYSEAFRNGATVN